VSKLAIKDIIIDPTIQIRNRNNESTIRRYEDSFDKLPPIVVFKTKEGFLLADGFHRIAAAERIGRKDVDVFVKTGSRNDALEFAVVANTKNGHELSPDERDEGIRRLKHLHGDWSHAKIADAMSISEESVRRVFAADKVKTAVLSSGIPTTGGLTDRHFSEIASAPREAWEPLIKATEKRGWSTDAVRLAVQNIKNTSVPRDQKAKILAGKGDPVARTEDGDWAVPAEVVGRRLRDMASNDAILTLAKASEQLAKLRLFKTSSIVKNAGTEWLDRIINEVPRDVEYLQELIADAKRERRKLQVVS
jgi:ParB-like chromosome segregation protein Spo0J